ncbi:Mitochondrial-processing peptidase subunit alpha [Orbilia oligospora]|uniref:Mitochondrial-processing peptidase subunit alpha n=2 Tax=Orbilia oligospora TaxID=2813651 RepID=A0A6G1MEG6_ORBOL|nr:Mitochondrial-processing peptidase subunit alpha [Orbilia oligospora]KAF3209979.1 Mitochondrial-processing peptidase subunit alpha [Orbilia oligospora]KAF3224085.1 Mitochondrial-processing peptidase subunit alpha [Orbilia oligospora]KAF3227701.1 Mitochondrial-processing peptidase subunit alpha [Orbilia oligospora]KAF3255836.1 Mitochondrial-processing peptidase subunit alpha [Orbilia oligospora]
MFRTSLRAAKRLPRTPIANPTYRRSFASLKPSSAESPDFEKVTTLPNGVRVATEAMPGHFSGVGVYLDAGARYEDDSLRGVSHIVDRLAFKSTKQRTMESMYESIERLGGNVQCISSRESIMYQSAVFNHDVSTAMGLLAETILDPLITQEEVEQQLETAEYEIGEIWGKSELILPELLHGVAYHNNTLGNPLLCPKERLRVIDRSTIEKYRSIFYKPERVVVAFAGVQHEDAIKLVEQYFGGMKSTAQLASAAQSLPSSANPKQAPLPSSNPKTLLSKMPFLKNLSTTASPSASHAYSYLDPRNPYPHLTVPSLYTGGQTEVAPKYGPGENKELTHIYIAFETPGIVSKDIYALATLQTLLGGGGSFSAGGPGKGMYSRLYTNVLNQYGWIESCVAFHHSYNDSGMFGIAASCEKEASGAIADVVLREMANTFTSSGYNALQVSEVERAKNQLRSSLLMNLESRMIELEDLGKQVQCHGRKIGPAEMCKEIEKLTVHDLRRIAEKVFTGKVVNVGGGSGRPSVVVQGTEEAVNVIGSVDRRARKYGLGRKP